MGEHGILFQDEMVRALLRPVGDPLRKTVTRRTSDRWARVKPGDLLWVRECFGLTDAAELVYRATEPAAGVHRWRPSIHMPRWASRLPLRVVSVRSEWGLLQDGLCTVRMPYVDDAEARREGVADRAAYLALWESINGPVYPEWVWRIEFEEVPRG